MKLLANKRGISLVLEAFIGFLLATFATVILIYVGFRLVSLLIPPTIDPATEANMNNLVKAINLLNSGNKEKDVIRHFPFHIGEDYILVGFPKGQGIIDDCRPLSLPSAIQRPLQCGDNACLCIYKNIHGFDDLTKQPLRCVALFNVDMIYSPFHSDESSMQLRSGLASAVSENLRAAPLQVKPKAYGGWTGQYQYFILYGQCMAPPAFSVQELYVDMHREEGKTFIFIAGESGHAQDRYNDLQEGLPGFPRTLEKQLEELIALIEKSKDPYQVNYAVFTVLTNPVLINSFLATHSLEEFKKLFFKRYEKNLVPIPTLTESHIKDNAEQVWEQYENVLIKLGYPGKPWYASTCVAAFKTGKEENECWVPKNRDLNR